MRLTTYIYIERWPSGAGHNYCAGPRAALYVCRDLSKASSSLDRDMMLFHDLKAIKHAYEHLSACVTTVQKWTADGNTCVFTDSVFHVCSNVSEADSFDISPYQCVNNPLNINTRELPQTHKKTEVNEESDIQGVDDEAEDVSDKCAPKEKRVRKQRAQKRKACNYDTFRDTILKNCDIFAHAGGPVWGLALCPFPRYNSSTGATTHFLVVGTSSLGWAGDSDTPTTNAPYMQDTGVGYDFPYEVGRPAQFPNILQVCVGLRISLR